jgi:uncharacterized protein (DUF3084 family)
VRSDSERIGREILQIENETKQIENEILRVRSDSERIGREILQIESETEQLRQENALLRQQNAKGRQLLASIDALCFPPESNSIPMPATEPASRPTSP